MPIEELGTFSLPATPSGVEDLGVVHLPVDQEVDLEVERRLREQRKAKVKHNLREEVSALQEQADLAETPFEEPEDPEAAVFANLDREKAIRAMVDSSLLKVDPQIVYHHGEAAESFFEKNPNQKAYRDLLNKRVKEYRESPEWSRLPGEVFGAMVGVGTGTASFIRGAMAANEDGRDQRHQQVRARYERNFKQQLDSGKLTQEEYEKALGRLDEYMARLDPAQAQVWVEENVFKPTAEAADEILKSVEEKGQELTADLIPQYVGTFMENPSWRRAASALASGAGSMAIAIPVSVFAGPEAGAALLSAAESGPMYRDAIAAGKTPQEAMDLAIMGGVATYLLEKYGLETILEATGGAAARFFKGALAEAGTEVAQTVVQNAIARHGYDASVGYLDGIVEAAIGGLVGGPAAMLAGKSPVKPGAEVDRETNKVTITTESGGTFELEMPEGVEITDDEVESLAAADTDKAFSETLSKIYRRVAETSAPLPLPGPQGPLLTTFREQAAQVVGEDEVAAVSAVLEARARAAGMTPDQYIESKGGIEIIPDAETAEDPGSEALRQQIEEEGLAPKAAVNIENGKRVIRAFEKADVSSLVHELGHIFRTDLSAEDLSAAENWAGVENGQWAEEHEEKFARGFERYLTTGEAPTFELRRVFAKLKTWLTEIYRGITGSSIGLNLTPEIKQVFDNLLAEQQQAQAEQGIDDFMEQTEAALFQEEEIRAETPEDAKGMVLRDALGNPAYMASISGFGRKAGSYNEPAYYSLGTTTVVDFPWGTSESFDELLKAAHRAGFASEVGRDGFGNKIARLVHEPTKQEYDKLATDFGSKWADAEDVFVRWGDLPEGGKSKNFRDNVSEQGVSVFHGKYLPESGEALAVPRTNDQLGSKLTMVRSGRPAYVVEGDVVGTGADGEPVLDNARVVAKLKTLYQRAEPRVRQSEIGFSSALRDGVASITARGMPAKDWVNRLRKMPGVKPDELKWTGVTEWLEAQDGKVSTNDLLAFLDANGVQVEEVVKGDISDPINRVGVRENDEGKWEVYFADTGEIFGTYSDVRDARSARERAADTLTGKTKFSQYTLPGGENYREVLLTLPDDVERRRQWYREEADRRGYGDRTSEWPDQEFADEYRRNVTLDTSELRFRGQHFDESNILAHVRLNDRTGPNGEKILFVEEIQSDFAQKGRKKGFGPGTVRERTVGDRTVFEVLNPAGEVISEETSRAAAERVAERTARGVPEAPFVDATDKWLALALKRVIRMAAEGGYDQVAWTPGEVQVERYDLSKHIQRVTYDWYEGDGLQGTGELRATGLDGEEVTRQRVKAADLSDHIGKDLAEKLLAQPVDEDLGARELSGLDLKVGGGGMTSFYDRIVPKAVQKVAKKLDKSAKVEVVSIDTKLPSGRPSGEAESRDVLSLPVTAKMRESAMAGQPLFQRADPQEEAVALPKFVKKAQKAVKTRVRRITGQRRSPVTGELTDKDAADLARQMQIQEGGIKALEAAIKQEAAAVRQARKEGVAHENLRLRWLVAQAAHKRRTRETAKRLRGRIKRELQLTKVKRQGGKPVGKFGPERQVALDKLREISKLSKAEASERLIANLERFADDATEMTDEVLLENRLLEAVARVDSMDDPVHLKELLEDIKAIKAEGRTLRESQLAARRERQAAARERILEELGGLPEDVEKRRADVEDYVPKERKELVKRFLLNLPNKIIGWDDLMDRLSLKSDSKPGESFISRDNVLRQVINAEQTGIRTSIETLHDAYMDAYGLKTNRQARRQFVKDGTEQIDVGAMTFLDEEGAAYTKNVQFTRAELRKRAMELMDPSLWPSFERMGYTEATAQQIFDLLTEQDLQFIAAQMEFYRQYYAGVNEVYREMYGVNLPHNEWYSPIAREGIATPELSTGEFGGEMAFRASAATAGSLKSRVGSTKLIKKTSDLEVMQRHISEMEHFKAWATKVRDLNAVWKDANIRDAIKIHHGREVLAVLDDFLEDFAYGGNKRKSIIKTLDWFRTNITTAVLAGKASITMKQLTSFVAYADAMPVADFAANYARFWAHPIENFKELRDASQMMQNRGESITRDLKEAMQTNEFKRFSEKKSFINMLLLNVKLGDHAAIYMGGWPLYEYLQEKKGLSKEDAVQEFERITANTQQSGDVTEQSWFQRGGSISKLLTMFMSSPNQYFRKYLGAIRNMKRQSPAQTAKTLFIYHILIPTLFQLVSDGFTWDEEEQSRARWLGPLNGIFIVGDLFDWIIRKAKGMRQFNEDTPMKDLVQDAARATKLVNYDDLTPEEFLAAVRALGSTVGGATGLPAKTAVDIAKGIKDVSDGNYLTGIYEIGGFSPYKAEQATRRLEQ